MYRDIHTSQNGRFQVGPKFRGLQRGRVYIGLNRRTDIGVAVKVERRSAKNGTLSHEMRVYDVLNAIPESGDIPQFQLSVTGVSSRLFGGTLGRHRFLILDRVGRNLDQISKDTIEQRISLKSMLMVGSRAVQALRAIHELGIVHTDICPRNIAVGRYAHDESTVYLLDFSAARRYAGGITEANRGIPLSIDQEQQGVTHCSPIARDAGRALGRRDDLEALAYSLVYIYTGLLPWTQIKSVLGSRRRARVAQMKAQVSSKTICKGMPREFQHFLTVIRKLGASAEPDYDLLQSLLDNAFFRLGYKDDCIYDWTLSFQSFPCRG